MAEGSCSESEEAYLPDESNTFSLKFASVMQSTLALRSFASLGVLDSGDILGALTAAMENQMGNKRPKLRLSCKFGLGLSTHVH